MQTSGGTDTINFSPIAALAPNTIYRLEIGAGVKDVDGRTFLPYATAFTTGTTTGGGGPVAFDKVAVGRRGRQELHLGDRRARTASCTRAR